MSDPISGAPGADRHPPIRIRGARQNNLRGVDLDIALNQLLVVTGVSGSGKSSLVFDTLYAEGQRRYVETFSAYARQFLDRMDKPQVERIEGVPPAIAIDQTNPVRTSRSTVGTMTELNDHLKLLFARAGRLHCRRCAQPVRRDSAATIGVALVARARAEGDPRLLLAFPVAVPANFGEDEVRTFLQAQGYTRTHGEPEADPRGGGARVLHVVQDRLRVAEAEPSRLADALEACVKRGRGRLVAIVLDEDGIERARWRWSTQLSCAQCHLDYTDPVPSHFSFNSPLGACETCRGFGRVIGIDLGLVVPDGGKTLREGAVRPWQTESFKDCQRDLLRHAPGADVPLDVPWRALTDAQRAWVIDGGADWKGDWNRQWYGVRRFFDWLESKAYKMHIRVLLSKYRSYTACSACEGARLKPDALLWRVGSQDDAAVALAAPEGEAPGRYARLRPVGTDWPQQALDAAAGLTLHDLMLLPIERVRGFFDGLALPAPLDEATDLLLGEIRSRLAFLCDVGLGYLTLDRQSRTLSGGEVQRINLTTALGTSLVNTLFVLDEPSIGLHPRDMGRVIAVMQRLRSAGNTLVVVEHDPQVMFAADRILDIGPGPGERGGRIVYHGTAAGIASADTPTGDYLAGRRSVDAGRRQPVTAATPRLLLEGAAEHNLRGVDVEIPLQRLVCITGVSGSGKSTLMLDVLLPALRQAKGEPTEAPGAFARLLGDDWIDAVVAVDQSTIGKTARSNPVSYVGAFDPIRKRFAASELARERGYTAGTFSFNAGDGRCPTCGGNGFEHVEMQFLSDVYLRCPDCDGRRFRPEVLEVSIRRGARLASVADVLEMTVHEALAFFDDDAEVRARLQPLVDVGLDYLRLGQPVPTLSGGEAQRLKLAGFLAEAAVQAARPGRQYDRRSGLPRRGTLFLFDEPTTGLHFDDVARLLRAFRKLLDAGHSLLVIEHNLDVIGAADWLIDLGPEGGDRGGRVVATGTPDAVQAHPASVTGQALREYRAALAATRAGAVPLAAQPPADDAQGMPLQSALRARARGAILVHRAREHNLKNIDVEVPREAMTVITGVSGSGKSTLAFDVIFGEGQRRYLESLNAYARQFVQPSSRPDVDGVFGIPPTVAIEQRTSRGGRKSTVATLTEIHHFLRLLYVRLGTQHCPKCDVPIEPQSFDAIVARILRDYRGRRIGLLAPLVVARKGVYTDLAAWARGKGFSHLRVDRAFLPTAKFPRLDRYVEHDIELPVADLVVDPAAEDALRAALASALEYGKGVVTVAEGLDALAAAIARGDATGASAWLDTRIFSTRRACRVCGTSFGELDPRLFSFNSKLGWCTMCYGTGVKLPTAPRTDDDAAAAQITGAIGDAAEALADEAGALAEACGGCNGQRLNPVALAVRLQGLSIAQLSALPVSQAATWFAGTVRFAGRQAEIARDVVSEIGSRLAFLERVGLGYLSLDRSAPTLSGGEAQRIRLAAQLGSNLQGVCYVLDEPTIGLHPRDNLVLLDTLTALRDKGNTLLVVEHDEDTIRRADHVIDIGPGAGRLGGRVVAQGSHDALAANPESVTGRFLAHPLAHPLVPRRPIEAAAGWLVLRAPALHNLRGDDVRLPLGRMSVITGVSGSGKSTVARGLLLPQLAAQLAARQARRAPPPPAGLAALEGWEPVQRVLEVDQTPIGKTPRSCPATYVGFWDAIRRQFADTAEARLRGYGPARFSFNTGEGRCAACEGQGMQRIEMSFLPDVKVPCDVCRGARFNRETLSVTLRGRSVGDVLAMSVDEAIGFFAAHPSVLHPLRLLHDVGLGYLTLGQPSPTLSGGESQRIKLVTELAKVRDTAHDDPRTRGRFAAPHTLYVLDEPTVGLHMADIEKLIRVLHRLVEAGNTLVIVEHNLDVWAEADWIVDLGPEGGAGGGRVVACGTPEALAARGLTHTERALATFLAREPAAPHAAAPA